MTIGRERKHGILEEKPQSDVSDEPMRKAQHSTEKSAAPPFAGLLSIALKHH
jgi:hypothetical protein